MTYIRFLQQQKILAIALALIGVYGGMSLSSHTRAQAHTARSQFSATHPHLPTTSLSLSNQTATTSLLNNQLQLQLAQASGDPTVPGGGHPRRTVGGGSQAQDPTVPGGGRPGRTVGGGSNVFPAPDEIAPGSRTGEAIRSRGVCPRTDIPLTALMPITQGTSSGNAIASTAATSESIYGLTVAERPTFWFYIPYSLTSSRPVEFVLQDANGNEVYQTQFTESSTVPGIVGFQIPPTVDPLEVGKRYHWYFLIYCNPEQPTFVEGWVERVALTPTLKTQLDQATTPQQKAALYAQAGIWHEALTTLAEVRRQNPTDEALNAQWIELLKSVDLNAIAKEPVTGVINP